jgi:tetraacyldisaccharide 4'-kinase
VAGDEPVLLAGELPGVSVVVSPDRHRAGLHALARLSPPPGLFLLDDGFSHLALQRDLDLLVFPAADPFGGGRLAPGGRLREPLASSERADAVLLTGALPEGSQSLGDELATALRPHGFRGPGFAAPTRAGAARRLTGGELPAGSRVVLASGIARPEAFASLARSEGFEIVRELPFGDHHDYPPSSLEAMARAVDETGADAVLVTSKDRVKLLGQLDLPLAELPIEAHPEPAFWQWLDGRLDRLFESGS